MNSICRKCKKNPVRTGSWRDEKYRDPVRYYTQCIECSNARQRKYIATLPSEFKRAKHKAWRDKNVQHVRNYWNTQNAKKRAEFFIEYGNKCACCGEVRHEFLTLDHIKEDGAEHRRRLGTSATSAQLADLKRRGWPKDEVQILCMNCNMVKAKNIVCPHKLAKRAYVPPMTFSMAIPA